MDIGTIIIIIIAAIGLGLGVYFQVSGKKNIAKAIWAGIGTFIIAMGFLHRKKISKIKEEGQEAINESKDNDENRTDVVEEIDDRIKTNEELINEINEALGDD